MRRGSFIDQHVRDKYKKMESWRPRRNSGRKENPGVSGRTGVVIKNLGFGVQIYLGLNLSITTY